jgi:hypothetical protein
VVKGREKRFNKHGHVGKNSLGFNDTKSIFQGHKGISGFIEKEDLRGG